MAPMEEEEQQVKVTNNDNNSLTMPLGSFDSNNTTSFANGPLVPLQLVLPDLNEFVGFNVQGPIPLEASINLSSCSHGGPTTTCY